MEYLLIPKKARLYTTIVVERRYKQTTNTLLQSFHEIEDVLRQISSSETTQVTLAQSRDFEVISWTQSHLGMVQEDTESPWGNSLNQSTALDRASEFSPNSTTAMKPCGVHSLKIVRASRETIRVFSREGFQDRIQVPGLLGSPYLVKFCPIINGQY